MKIEIASKKRLESVDFKNTNKIIVVSVTSSKPAKIKNLSEDRILRLEFDDVDYERQGKLMSIFHVIEIKEFVEKHKDIITMIVVSCDAGISRSSAIAAALSLWLNSGDMWVWESSKYCPNMFIYRMMVDFLIDNFEESEIEKREEINLDSYKTRNNDEN